MVPLSPCCASSGWKRSHILQQTAVLRALLRELGHHVNNSEVWELGGQDISDFSRCKAVGLLPVTAYLPLGQRDIQHS